MSGQPQGERDLERELLENYPELALLLRRAAQMHAWQPSAVGERLLRHLAAAVAEVLDRRMSPNQADAFMAEVIAETRQWIRDRRAEQGREGYSP